MAGYTLMAFGPFVFGMHTAAYDELRRQMQFKHGAAVRVGERDNYQYLGAGEEIISLSGAVAPSVTGTLASITQLENLGAGGQAYVLVDGAGYVYGVYFIDRIETTQRYLFPDGTPRKVEFSITFYRSDNLPADEPVNNAGARP